MGLRTVFDVEAYRFERTYSNMRDELIKSIDNNRVSSKFCVVVHLYYTENWNLFLGRLANLSNVSFDIVITIPEHNEVFRDTIWSSYPDAHIVSVPNRGRDVLPFINVAKVLTTLNYEYVLKFHSKKSTHWEGGQTWLEGMMEHLLPADGMADIIGVIEKTETGIVGPEGVYYPLTVNFPANGLHMDRMVRRIFGRLKAHEVLQIDRKKYGFFGGTMFWARLDAIKPLFDARVVMFESERGQVDGTYAHALERLFCVIPEINGRSMYEIHQTGLRTRSYESLDIPEWSEDHDK